MPIHQLDPAIYQFYDSGKERLMFRSETKVVEKVLPFFVVNKFKLERHTVLKQLSSVKKGSSGSYRLRQQQQTRERGKEAREQWQATGDYSHVF